MAKRQQKKNAAGAHRDIQGASNTQNAVPTWPNNTNFENERPVEANQFSYAQRDGNHGHSGLQEGHHQPRRNGVPEWQTGAQGARDPQVVAGANQAIQVGVGKAIPRPPAEHLPDFYASERKQHEQARTAARDHHEVGPEVLMNTPRRGGAPGHGPHTTTLSGTAQDLSSRGRQLGRDADSNMLAPSAQSSNREPWSTTITSYAQSRGRGGYIPRSRSVARLPRSARSVRPTGPQASYPRQRREIQIRAPRVDKHAAPRRFVPDREVISRPRADRYRPKARRQGNHRDGSGWIDKIHRGSGNAVSSDGTHRVATAPNNLPVPSFRFSNKPMETTASFSTLGAPSAPSESPAAPSEALPFPPPGTSLVPITPTVSLLLSDISDGSVHESDYAASESDVEMEVGDEGASAQAVSPTAYAEPEVGNGVFAALVDRLFEEAQKAWDTYDG